MKKYPNILWLLNLQFLLFNFSASANILSFANTSISKEEKIVYDADFLFQVQLTQVFLSSQQLAEALVLNNAKKAQEAAKIVESLLSKVNRGLLPEEPQSKWVNQARTLHTSLAKIASGTNSKNQRIYFAQFSEALFNSLKTFGIEGEVAYYQYCPMAMDGEGAFWLSSKKQIRNPYLGNKMLTCGSVKEVIK